MTQLKKLPAELTGMIINSLPSRDIARLRLASLAVRKPAITLFQRLLTEEKPWFCEG
jgi:hypothetical protein